MKSFKLFASTCVLAGFSLLSEAAVYQVGGEFSNLSTGNEQFFPGSYSEVYTPANPAYIGYWHIDIAAETLLGILDVEPYNLTATITGMGTVSLTQTSNHWTITGTSLSYDSVNRVLTVEANVFQKISQECVSTGTLSCKLPAYGEPPVTTSVDEYIANSFLSLSLIFDPSLQTFIASGTHSDGYGASQEINFAGTAVPLPAAVWLLGSGITGLGVTRRYRKKA